MSKPESVNDPINWKDRAERAENREIQLETRLLKTVAESESWRKIALEIQSRADIAAALGVEACATCNAHEVRANHAIALAASHVKRAENRADDEKDRRQRAEKQAAGIITDLRFNLDLPSKDLAEREEGARWIPLATEFLTKWESGLGLAEGAIGIYAPTLAAIIADAVAHDRMKNKP